MARHAFKSDTAELKRWLSKRKSSLENARRPMEAIWRDIRLYYEPNIGKAGMAFPYRIKTEKELAAALFRHDGRCIINGVIQPPQDI